MTCEIVPLTEGRLILPDPASIPTHYPSTEEALNIYPGLVGQLQLLGKGHLRAAFGYGSIFNGESKNGLLDIMLIVDDPKEFHRQHRRVSAGVQTWLNQFSPNFYPGQIMINGQPRAVKYGVIGYEDFLMKMEDPLLYTKGRFAKAALFPFVKDPDQIRQARIGTAINRSRFESAWTVLASQPTKFDFEHFALDYINLSYWADVRVEKDDKARILLTQSPEDYKIMLGDILNAFVKGQILEREGDQFYTKKVSPRKEDVQALVLRSKLSAIGLNYIKNWITYGPAKGPMYAGSKFFRTKIKPLVNRIKGSKGSQAKIVSKKLTDESIMLTAKDLASMSIVDGFVFDLSPKYQRFVEKHFSWLLGQSYSTAKKILASLDNKKDQ